ncbi:T-cell activation inhibitor, mitochondrial [Gryllus bimaculatus]|nr:T-cell activation inhibitor, mitochondrial [Gryllus bimaculatus]
MVRRCGSGSEARGASTLDSHPPMGKQIFKETSQEISVMTATRVPPKRYKWALDSTTRGKPDRSSDLASPPGYNPSAGQVYTEVTRESDPNHLIIKKSWELALGPLKQVPMNLFIMYMAGNSISIFPIMMVGMLIIRPVKALFTMQNTFKMIEGSHAAGQKFVYFLGNIVSVALALYKCHSMGLLPSHSSDWLAFVEPQMRMEYSGGVPESLQECVRLNYVTLIKSCFSLGSANALNIYRCLSSAEVSTALRPFYFSVHPDLFGQYPDERIINENSLKQLSSYIETLQQRRPARPTSVTFYLRSRSNGTNVSKKGSFRSVKIDLKQRDLRKTVLSILKSCDLPTTYVDNIAPAPKQEPSFGLEIRKPKFDENDPIFGAAILRREVKQRKDGEKLSVWLEKNVEQARMKLAACQPVREEIIRLQITLQDALGVQRVLWDCGWNVTHFRGCLQSFQALARHHPDVMHVLKGRTLMFGNDTGVSMDGHVMLNSGEVRHNWLDLIKNVHKHDIVLLRIPSFEKAVSRVLRDIRVVRRKFQPKVMAKHYENHLRRLTTSLSDHQGRFGYPREWPEKLDKFELVVETEAGPLMVSPTGQFIVPASCPGSLVVSFIDGNMEEATSLLLRYKSNKHVERDLVQQCVDEFQLAALHKDDNITPELMIACCKQMLQHQEQLRKNLLNTRIWVTNYYSVLSDGEMCIPWNWKL